MTVHDASHSIIPGQIASRPVMARLIRSRMSRPPKVVLEKSEYRIVLDPPILKKDVRKAQIEAFGKSDEPRSNALYMGSVGVLSSAGKMGCWGFNLPAGPQKLLGTCPGSRPGFPMLTPRQRVMALSPAAKATGVRPERWVCSGCYACKGQYMLTSNILSIETRRQFVIGTLEAGGPSALAAVMVPAIREAQARSVRAIAKRRASGQTAELYLIEDPYFFRLHDSGDFFTPAYWNAWVEIAAAVIGPATLPARTRRTSTGKTVVLVPETEVPGLVIWAPTRQWVPEGGGFCPNSQDVRCLPPNLIVRPSGLHFREPAPRLEAMGYAAGTAAAPIEIGRTVARWPCPAYLPPHEGGGAKWQAKQGKWVGGMCSASIGPGFASGEATDARSPDGWGCRACWMRPDLTVAYQEH